MKFSIKLTAIMAAVLIAVIATITVINAVPAKNNTEIGPEIPIVAKGQTPQSNELAPLKLELPEPVSGGTPSPWPAIENLEEKSHSPRPTFMVPAGTVNVAAGKKVMCSDSDISVEELAMITDGDKSSLDGSWVELGLYEQNVTIDLGAQHEIYAILVWHFHREKQYYVYFDVVAQVADEPDFITNVTTVFNNDIDDSSGLGIGKHKNYVETNEGKLIDAKGTRGRYVRMHSNANNINDLNHYVEVEIYGKPVEEK